MMMLDNAVMEDRLGMVIEEEHRRLCWRWWLSMMAGSERMRIARKSITNFRLCPSSPPFFFFLLRLLLLLLMPLLLRPATGCWDKYIERVMFLLVEIASSHHDGDDDHASSVTNQGRAS
jgi:hypothetical protein